ncbi:hypothetical protein Dtox_2788 [Desulfofarcimen acetoxidans DSM 771]|uniref:Uncharacterized protein n=1 Tax=Desulfofarcimen acetoxidans (strain ATCC 49208 / DSM 771 / KCTC 5769 / VKM B-1644 / 5575) TaxID=485916 RepID=C8W1T5_DESAS|nr:hypothetical protein [Desulfofarcimen acetoxidans]ACV63556.1 hypothetical protein Dtox_2788 [Desulfofarcimen acetoxidans DSM 771]
MKKNKRVKLSSSRLKKIFLDAGADDVGFVEIGRTALKDFKEAVLELFPDTKTLVSIVIKVILLGLLLITTTTVGYYVQSDKKSDVKQAKTYSTETANMLAMPDQERQKVFDNTASFRWSYTNAEEAGKNLPFQFKMPSESLTGKPTAFYVTKNDKYSDRLLLVHYANGVNGITLSAILDPAQPDFADHVNKLKAEINSGINHADKLPSLIDIDGISAFAIETGYNNIEGDKVPRSGVFEWWKDGVTYSLLGTRGPEGTSLDQLIAIAKSLNNSKKVILPGIIMSPSELNSKKVIEPKNNEPQVDMEKGKQGKTEYEE